MKIEIDEAEYKSLLALAETAKLIQFQRAHNSPNMTTVHKSDRDALKQALADLAAVKGGPK